MLPKISHRRHVFKIWLSTLLLLLFHDFCLPCINQICMFWIFYYLSMCLLKILFHLNLANFLFIIHHCKRYIHSICILKFFFYILKSFIFCFNHFCLELLHKVNFIFLASMRHISYHAAFHRNLTPIYYHLFFQFPVCKLKHL